MKKITIQIILSLFSISSVLSASIGDTISDIGAGTGNFLNLIQQPLVTFILGLGMVGVVLMLIYVLFKGLDENIMTGNIV